MYVLAIDTSNKMLSVGIVKDGVVLAEHIEETKNNHSSKLMPAIQQAFSEWGKTPSEIDLIAVAHGPGSYTGVRIGVTVAKTLAWTLGKPLVGVSSLEVIARNASDGVVVPLFDARRQTVFAGVYHKDKNILPDGHYEIGALLEQLPDKSVHFVGDTAVYRDIIRNFGTISEDNVPKPLYLAQIALEKEPVEDVHGFKPQYLRLPEAEVNWLKEQKAHV